MWKKYSPVVDVHASDFKKVGTIFRKMKPGTNEEMPPTATAMADHFL